VRVTVDQDVCCGSGMCVLTAPDIFTQRDTDGIVELRTDTVPPSHEDQVREAALLCPSGAITTH